VCVLGRLGLEELAARRGVEIEVAHLDAGAGGQRGGLGLRDFRAAGGHRPGVLLARAAARQRAVRHRGDARERFATEAEAADPFQVLERADLARGVAGERELQFVARDAAAIVRDLDELGAAPGEYHGNFTRAGVEAVLQQFLEGRCRPLDDFPRGDLADQEVREDADGGHMTL